MFLKWLWTTLETILLQKTASEGQKLWHFSYRALWSIARQSRWAQSPWLRYWLQVCSSSSSVRRIFERVGGRKFENNEDQKKNLSTQNQSVFRPKIT